MSVKTLDFKMIFWTNFSTFYLVLWVLKFQLFINKYLWGDYEVAVIILSTGEANVDKIENHSLVKFRLD